jgi:drug/metabolite transporter (DMT)-like permease
VCAMTVSLQSLIYFNVLKTVSVTTISVAYACTPVVVGLAAWLLFREQPSWPRVVWGVFVVASMVGFCKT